MITQEYLKSRLRYDPDTGHFVWVNAPPNWLRIIGQRAGWPCNGYVQISIDGKQYYAHRLAWLYIYGLLPKQLDHKNRTRTDNRINNLRLCTTSQNGANKSKHVNNDLPMGVAKHKGKFQAGIMLKGKSIYLGRFDTPEEASSIYQVKKSKLFGEFA